MVTNGTGFTGAGGATEPDNWWTTTSVRGIHTITNDGGSHTACLLLEVDSDPTADPYISHDGITVVIGKRYRFSAYYKNVDADSLRIRLGTALGGSQVMSFMDLTATSWTKVTGDFTATTTTVHPLLRLVSDGAGEGGLFDNISIVQIGAVAEYDGSGIASDKWFDKSGNDLHGTITAGATAPTVENAPSGDDGLVYEEGTWTPAWVNGPTSNYYSQQTGHYIRVGKMCTLWCQIVTSDMNSQTGDADVGGLPFTANSSTITATGPINCDNGWDTNLSTNNLICLLLSGAATLKPRKNSGSNTSTIQLEEIGGGDSYFCVTITYEVQ